MCVCACVCVHVCACVASATKKGCRDAGRQTFLELPGNPLATKRGKCVACYDALCNCRNESEEKA